MTWENFCLNHKIAVTTANRYINFSNWCRLFPRLVVSGIELTTLESYREELNKHLEVDDELRRKLEGPVREMQEDRDWGSDLPVHVDDQHQPMGQTNNDWYPGYQWRDEIAETMDREEEASFSSSPEYDDAILDDKG